VAHHGVVAKAPSFSLKEALEGAIFIEYALLHIGVPE
jgi:hypothetical protein